MHYKGGVVRIVLIWVLGLFLFGRVFAEQVLGLPPLPTPDDNPQTVEKIALGKALFNDPRLSGDGSISCASCHMPDKGFADALPVARGIRNQTGTRNTPTVINAAYYQALFLDGRAASLEGQALGPLLNPIEHGLPNTRALIDVVCSDKGYLKQFQDAFGQLPNGISANHVAQALAAFERTLIAGNSPFDRYLYGRDRSALSQSAERGMRIFKRKGNCLVCHEISWDHALFSDQRFYNLGVGSQKLEKEMDAFIAAVNAGKDPDDYSLTTSQRSDLGRFNVTKNPTDIGKFKTPILRNVALTAPYMHDGSLKTLEDVVNFYDQGGKKNRFLDKKIFPLNLTAQEKADLVAFLQSLTSLAPDHERQ